MRTLYLTSPLMAGGDVLDVQQRLKARGYDPGPRDGLYGVGTVYAVRSFQTANRLVADGIYGPLTAKALHPVAKPPAPVKTPAGVRALQEARRQIGVTEHPSDSNRTVFGKWFGIDGVPWCAIFASYCFSMGAGEILGGGSNNPARGFYPHGMCYVPFLEAWLKTSGQWIGKVAPHPGDLAIFDWDGGVADHVGVVETYQGGGKFVTVEGNTAVGNDTNGGEVMRRHRYISQVHGFGRVR